MISVRLDRFTGCDISQLQSRTPDSHAPHKRVPTYATMRMASSSRRRMTRHLRRSNVSENDRNCRAHSIYILTSDAVDLQINEVIDRPICEELSQIRKSIFPELSAHARSRIIMIGRTSRRHRRTPVPCRSGCGVLSRARRASVHR
jgi:hypothetical protein